MGKMLDRSRCHEGCGLKSSRKEDVDIASQLFTCCDAFELAPKAFAFFPTRVQNFKGLFVFPGCGKGCVLRTL